MSKEELLAVIQSTATNAAAIASSVQEFWNAQAEKARLIGQTLSGVAAAVAESPGDFVLHLKLTEGSGPMSPEAWLEFTKELREAFAKVGITGLTVTSPQPTAQGDDPVELTLEGKVEE